MTECQIGFFVVFFRNGCYMYTSLILLCCLHNCEESEVTSTAFKSICLSQMLIDLHDLPYCHKLSSTKVLPLVAKNNEIKLDDTDFAPHCLFCSYVFFLPYVLHVAGEAVCYISCYQMLPLRKIEGSPVSLHFKL